MGEATRKYLRHQEGNKHDAKGIWPDYEPGQMMLLWGPRSGGVEDQFVLTGTVAGSGETPPPCSTLVAKDKDARNRVRELSLPLVCENGSDNQMDRGGWPRCYGSVNRLGGEAQSTMRGLNEHSRDKAASRRFNLTAPLQLQKKAKERWRQCPDSGESGSGRTLDGSKSV
jgi:hypothetical protein